VKNTTVRLFIVVSLVGLVATSTYVFPAWLKPKEIRLPDWDLSTFPLQFDSWQGAQVELDEKIMERILRDAEDAVDRAYADDANQAVSLHVALFRDLDRGIIHSPYNCYRGAGWTRIDDTQLMLRVSEESSIPVSLTTWELQGKRVMVMYWYQLDEHILFDRLDLGMARWKMRNKETWPAMVKVLLQTSAADPDKGKERIQIIAQRAYQWLNRPAPQPGSGTRNG
jgi:EpsI family protein